MTNEQVAATIDQLIRTALERGGNAVHIEPGERRVTVRLRLDGRLELLAKLPRHLEPAITEHVQSLADGRLDSGHKLTITATPTEHGTHHVLHLPAAKSPQTLTELGYGEDASALVENMLSQPHGLILTASPDQRHADMMASSFAALLHGIGRNTEDARDQQRDSLDINPIDRNRYPERLERLRHALHGNSAIIIADSLVDQASSEFALEAALSGRFMLASMSAAGSVQALRRLLDLQLAPHIVAATLRGIAFQRPVRALCSVCREAYAPTQAALQRYAKRHGIALKKQTDVQLWRASKLGCASCHYGGYKGTIGLVEVLSPSTELRQAIAANQPIDVLGTASAVIPAAYDGFVKASHGLTSLEEISRARYR